MIRKILIFKMKIRQFGITFLTLGGILFINNLQFSTFCLVVGALLLAFYYYISSFDKINKDINWELAFPELAVGVDKSKNKEYEYYISGKERIHYMIFQISKSYFIISLSMKFFIHSTSNANLNLLSIVTSISLFVSGIILAIYYILGILEPIHVRPNWELVFPELKQDRKVKK